MPVETAWPVFKHLIMIFGIEASPLSLLLFLSESYSFSLQLANCKGTVSVDRSGVSRVRLSRTMRD